MAAKRAGVKEVFIPKQNEKDLDEIDPVVRESLTFHLVENIDEVLQQVICWDTDVKKPRRRTEKKSGGASAGLAQ